MQTTILRAALLALVASGAQAAEPQDSMMAYLDDHLRAWVSAPVLVTAIQRQNTQTAAHDPAMIDALDQTWRGEVGAAATPLIDSVLMTEAAAFLRSQVEASGGMVTEVFVMDARGLNVAASGITSDYWQGDEAKFQQT